MPISVPLGAVSDGPSVGKVLLAAGAALGLIILVDQASRQQQEPGPKA